MTNASEAEKRPFVRLDQLLKFAGVVQTGGHAKIVIQNGEVVVNGTIETRRGRKLVTGDVVQYEDWLHTVSPDEVR